MLIVFAVFFRFSAFILETFSGLKTNLAEKFRQKFAKFQHKLPRFFFFKFWRRFLKSCEKIIDQIRDKFVLKC